MTKITSLIKKITPLFLLIAAFALAACTSDDSLSAQGGETVNVTYTVTLPEEIDTRANDTRANADDTRAYSDGKTAVYLTYGVYDSAGDLVLSNERATLITDKQAVVDLTLVKGATYSIVFWVDAGKNSNYTLNLASNTVTMNYTASKDSDSDESSYIVAANNERRDAFWAVDTGVEASSETRTVTLRRPFAQLNFGTDDLSTSAIKKNYPVVNMEFTLTMPKNSLAETFNLIDGTVDNAINSTVCFTSTGTPAESDGTFPISGYSYLQMNYLLPYIAEAEDATSDEVAAAGRLVLSDDVTFTAQLDTERSTTVTVANMPLQRNYYTNVYGSLLTNSAVYNMTIVEAYDDHYCIKDGVLYYCVTTAGELADAIADNQPAILLKADIETTSCITLNTATLINLNGHTLTVDGYTSEDVSGTSYMISLAASATNDLSIVNGDLVLADNLLVSDSATLTMEDVALTTTDTTAQVQGIIYNSASTESTITNCTIDVSSTQTTHAVNNKSDGAITLVGCTLNVACTLYGTSNYNAYACGNSGTGVVSMIDCEINVSSLYITHCAYNEGEGTVLFTGCKITIIGIGDSCYITYCLRNVGDGFGIFTSCDITVISNSSSQNACAVSNSLGSGTKGRALLRNCTVYTSNTAKADKHIDINNNHQYGWVGYVNCEFTNSTDTTQPVIGSGNYVTSNPNCTITIVQKATGKVSSMTAVANSTTEETSEDTASEETANEETANEETTTEETASGETTTIITGATVIGTLTAASE